MYGPPTIPALGGGLLTAAAVALGHYAGIIWAMSLVLIVIFVLSFIKLIKGQIAAHKLQG